MKKHTDYVVEKDYQKAFNYAPSVSCIDLDTSTFDTSEIMQLILGNPEILKRFEAAIIENLVNENAFDLETMRFGNKVPLPNSEYFIFNHPNRLDVKLTLRLYPR